MVSETFAIGLMVFLFFFLILMRVPVAYSIGIVTTEAMPME